MDLNTFLDHFDTIAEAPGGIAKLRALILDLAVRGKLVSQNLVEGDASELLKQVDIKKSRLIKDGKIRSSKSLGAIPSENIPYALPINWEWVWLDDISDIGTGSTPLTSNPSYYEDGIIPWITSTSTSQDFISKTESYITELAVKDYRLKMYKPGTLIVALYGQGKTRGQISSLEFSAAINQACAAISLIEDAKEHKEYIRYLFKKNYEGLRALAAGGAQPNLNVGKIKTTLVPLPPLAEQKRIVEKVDELMALCDRLAAAKQTRDDLRQKLRGSAIAALMNAETDEALEKSWAIVRDNWHTLSQDPKDVDDLRRLNLQLAVRGKLIAQSSEDKLAKSTLSEIAIEQQKLAQIGQLKKDSELAEIETGDLPSLPQGWEYCYFQDLKTFGPRNGYSPKAVEYPTSVRSITLTATTSGRFNGQFFKYIDEQIENESHLWLQPGDLLIQRSNTLAYVGTAAVYDQPPAKYIYPDLIMRVRLSEKADVRYIHLFLSSKAGKQHFQSNASGTSGTMPKINQRVVNSLIVPLPPLAEQKRIVAKVDELMQMCDQLEASLRQSQQRASALAASAISHLTI